ncbi:Uncharacterised protein [uncultured archaeon]|nr:Uncharacterised protein [uncultured archaeon]
MERQPEVVIEAEEELAQVKNSTRAASDIGDNLRKLCSFEARRIVFSTNAYPGKYIYLSDDSLINHSRHTCNPSLSCPFPAAHRRRIGS